MIRRWWPWGAVLAALTANGAWQIGLFSSLMLLLGIAGLAAVVAGLVVLSVWLELLDLSRISPDVLRRQPRRDIRVVEAARHRKEITR